MAKLGFLTDNPYAALIARLIIGAVFIFAGIEKIASPEAFAKSIQNYQILPIAIINIMALILPWLELIAGLFLVFGIRIKSSSAIVGGLLVIFIIAILSAMMRGLNIDCGCFSQDGAGTKVGWGKILENLGMVVLTAYLYFFPNAKLPFENR